MSVDTKHHIETWITLVIEAIRWASMAAFLLLFLANPATAAPAIKQASGTFNHKGTVTITGSGFGVKAQAAPVVWDDASGSNILNRWDGAWPDQSPSTNTAYRTPQRGIALPHNRIASYIAGAHYPGTGADAGYNVIFWKNRSFASYPAYTYASWYQRFDNAWTFGGDDNTKTFAFSVCCGPYEMPKNWYMEYNARPTSTTSIPSWHMYDDGAGQSYQSLDGNKSWWYGSAVNPMGGQWAKIEVEIKYTNQSDGYITLWENGVRKIDYVGTTDRYPGMERTEGIGGYARNRNSTNWRYYADVYLDYTPARVVLANNASLSSATIIETQIPTSWNDNSVNFTVNLGKFTTGQTAYLFVVDSSGIRNATGFPITVGAPAPNPSNLHFL